MSTPIGKKVKRIEEYSSAERSVLYIQSPYFVEKRKQAEEFLKKAGLPERHKKGDK